MSAAFIHPTAIVDPPVSIGVGSRIWHFTHVMAEAHIGADSSIGQGCFVGRGVIIGNRCKLQNNVSVFEGVELEDDVFVGPSAVFTNVTNPRAAVSRRADYEKTRVRLGASIGANATILPGVTLDEYCFVGAGATVTRDVPRFALVLGVPARRAGWMSRHGERLEFDQHGRARCPATLERYVLIDGRVRPEE